MRCVASDWEALSLQVILSAAKDLPDSEDHRNRELARKSRGPSLALGMTAQTLRGRNTRGESLAQMNILVIGSGGREHALTWKLKHSAAAERIFCAVGNDGTAQIAENVQIPANDFRALIEFANQNKIDLTVVGPDDPLAAGIVDAFQAENLRIFGPTKSAARLESSKIFAKELMRENRIATAAARTFAESDEAKRYAELCRFPVVIKADGLALGKGVIIAPDTKSAAIAITEMMEQEKFGEAGRRIIIEDLLRGWECSLHVLVDGENYQMLATARDHKRAYDGDAGPNTGGMGAFSPAEEWSDKLQTQFDTEIIRPLLAGLRESGVSFRGLLFPGLMVTEEGARVLEFNCRFGDPETQAILPRLKSDLLQLLEATIDGELAEMKIDWDDRVAVTVVMASGGYPEKYETGKVINGLDEAAKLKDVQIFHAGTRKANGDIVTSGGRVLAVTALGVTRAEARERAYDAVAKIHFDDCHYRRDIALEKEPDKLA
jgi:phosphoribosylamine--glycine ligase